MSDKPFISTSALKAFEELTERQNLSAAAPELLEACEEFVRKVECGAARSTQSYEQMKKAIAKAKGE